MKYANLDNWERRASSMLMRTTDSTSSHAIRVNLANAMMSHLSCRKTSRVEMNKHYNGFWYDYIILLAVTEYF